MTVYLIDANVLIRAHGDYYPIDRIKPFWDWLLAHWCSFGLSGAEPRSGVVSDSPSACRDGLGRLPLDGPPETSRAAGAGRSRRTTG